MTTRILVADDHPLFRDAIIHLLQRTIDDLQVAQADSFSALSDELASQPLPSMLLLDLKLSDSQGLDNLLTLKKKYPSLPILVVSAYDEGPIVRMAMQYGASGFIPKSLDMDRMADVVQRVLAGDMWFPDVVDDAKQTGDSPAAGFEELTAAQLKVLSLLRDGMPSKEMAAIMSVTEATIKAHLTEIFRKLNVKNRTQAVLVARDLDLPEGPAVD